jgi:hypothetical protein
MFSDAQLANALFAFPFLALALVFVPVQIVSIRAELSRIRSARVVARREGGR